MVAVIVAHPDDEALWFGGLLSQWQKINPTYPLTLWVLGDSVKEPARLGRASKVSSACGAVMFQSRIPDISGHPLEGVEQALKVGGINHFDVIFTHNYVGEYGHRHHIQVHEAVLAQANNHADIYVSGYGLPLRRDELPLVFDWREKLDLIECYDHSSTLMGIPKHKELVWRWSQHSDLHTERYVKL